VKWNAWVDKKIKKTVLIPICNQFGH